MMSDFNLKIPVLKVEQPIGTFFVAGIRARDLVEISYSDVRRLAEDQRDLEKYLGIQRPVSKRRINEIKKYIDGDDSTFPTAVVLAVDEKCVVLEKVTDEFYYLSLSAYYPEEGVDEDPIPKGKIAKVIDGQHRIAAFMDESDNWTFDDETRIFDINVSIFVGADVAEQANIFATVNLAQTKVNRSLVYDLTELAKTDSPFKTCHNVAVVLDGEPTSPFFERIKRLGTATPGRKREPLTQAAFVESLVRFISADPVVDRNMLIEGKRPRRADHAELLNRPFRNLFLDGKDLDVAEILYNYFEAVKSKWPNSWERLDVTGNLLPKSNSFKALMKYLKEDVYLTIVGDDIGRIPSKEEFLPFFDGIELKDEDFTARNFVPGSGGQAMFLKLLRGQVNLEDIVEE
jgi:DGQHR domain-containing protein